MLSMGLFSIRELFNHRFFKVILVARTSQITLESLYVFPGKRGTRPLLIPAQGTPIIDPNTNTVFFFSKGYKNGASNGGVANGE
jgi:hypothetical protein